jgi:hypothetical protein
MAHNSACSMLYVGSVQSGHFTMIWAVRILRISLADPSKFRGLIVSSYFHTLEKYVYFAPLKKCFLTKPLNLTP